MVYKANVGDFPLKVYPCKHWWVRYAVACTHFSAKYEELIRACLETNNLPLSYSFRETIPEEWKDEAKVMPFDLQEMFVERRIWIYRDKKEVELKRGSKEHRILNGLLSDKIGWVDCPFENEDQSKCPFYEVEGHTTKYSLEELRQRKGYDV